MVIKQKGCQISDDVRSGQNMDWPCMEVGIKIRNTKTDRSKYNNNRQWGIIWTLTVAWVSLKCDVHVSIKALQEFFSEFSTVW